jgi:hypothetical protein
MKFGPEMLCLSIVAIALIVYIYNFLIDNGVFPALILIAGYFQAIFIIFKYFPILVVLEDVKIRGVLALGFLMDTDPGFGLAMLFVAIMFVFPLILAFLTASIIPGAHIGVNSFIVYSIIQVLILFGADYNTDSTLKKFLNAAELALAAASLIFSLIQTFLN